MQRIIPMDEYLNHQIAETFATVGESDNAWTEKIWCSLFAKDGSLQIDAGLGKYHNRNVMDGFAGASQGKRQLTVRASRRLDNAPDLLGVGPIVYEIVEPLTSARFSLAPNEQVPLSFDLTMTRVLPPFLENPDRQRDPFALRVSSDLLRYHQACTVSGWIRIEDEEIEVRDEEWAGFRDHSWGVRMDVGSPAADVFQVDRLAGNFVLQWSPMVLFPGDGGAPYEFHHYLQSVDEVTTYFSGYINHADGRQEPVRDLRDDLRYDRRTRRLLGGTVTLDMGWGETRTIEIEPVSDTGFHLGTANYFGHKGKAHGVWLGDEHQDGEIYSDMTEPETLRAAHQLRDCVIRVREENAEGFGIFESMVIGEHARYGLDRAGSFL
ncbi:MAG TPA: hypothetical protein VHX88_17560 [Solirubrobacteraceae bacterium]|jgi:hypothetical protein|nr:hypothetical protein [Solirubrobacteraceae bacterium]